MTDASPKPAGPFALWERSIALRYLRARRRDGGVALVSIISFIGVMLAVAVLIIVMSVMNGFRAELLGRILGFNGHMFVTGQLLNDPSSRDAAIARIRAVPGVIQAIPVVEAQGLVMSQGRIAPAVIRGVRRADLEHIKLIADNIRPGSIDGYGVGEYGGEQILLGSRLAADMDARPGDAVTLVSPVGASTPFGSTPRTKAYEVGGLFTVGMSQYDEAYVYMPLAQAQLFFGRDQAVDVIEIKLADPDRAEAMRAAIARAAGPDASVTTWKDRNQAFFGALQVERNVMRLILMLIVGIAAMNIVTGLIMLVKNKGRDIAILRTMGASRGSILRIFFMSGAAIGVAGALTGVVVGVLFCAYIDPIQGLVQWVTGANVFNADVYFLSHLPAKIDWGEVAGITVFSTLMSFIATLPQAWHASRLDPVEALRYE